MNKFQEIMAKIDPEKKILTETVQTELVALMEEKDKKIKEEAFKEAFLVADKKIAQLNEDSKKKLDEALKAQDAEHVKKFKEILDKQDADHIKKMDTLVEEIDKNHTAQAKKAVNHMDMDHTKKIKIIVEKYENKLKKLKDSAINEKLITAIDGYIGEYIKEVLPESKVVNETRLARLEKMYGQIREMVMVNDETFQTEIKEAVLDAKKIIDGKDGEIDKLMFENIELKKKIEKNEAVKLLENKVKDVAPKMRAYLEVCFKDAGVKEIEERFDEAVKAFKDEEDSRRRKIVSESESKKKIVNPVKAKEDEIKPIVEQKRPDIMDSYAGTVAKMVKPSILG